MYIFKKCNSRTQDALDTIDKETELSDNISKTNRIVSVGAFVESIVYRNALNGGDDMKMNDLREHLINLQKEEIAKKDKELAEKDEEIKKLKEQLKKYTKIAAL